MISLKFIPAIVLLFFAAPVLAQQPANQVWLFVGDPDAAMAGKSSCPPCNRLCLDLQKYKTADGNPLIGHGKDSMFKLIKAAPGTVIPRIQFPGEQDKPGYSGDHEKLIQKHPDAGRVSKGQTVRRVSQEPEWNDEANIRIRIRPAIAERSEAR